VRTALASAAWQVVEEFLELSRTMGDSRSPLGGMIEALRLGQTGQDDSHLWRRAEQAEQQHHRFAVLELHWARLGRGPSGDRPDIGEVDQQIIIAAHTPTRDAPRFKELHHGGPPLTREGNLDSDEMQRRSGWEQVGVWRDHLGQRLRAREGCLWFKRMVPSYPTESEVAARLHLSPSRVKDARHRCIAVFCDVERPR